MNEVDLYLDMQRRYYSVAGDNDNWMDALVGGYDQHEAYPYEKFLLEHYDRPTEEDIALDFGCGPGRMIRRMSQHFHRVDGVDISEGMTYGARRRCVDLPFQPFLWVIDGKSLPGIPNETYDFVYCTISFHHICSYPIRMSLLSEFSRVLRRGGKICLHFMYTTQPREQWPHHVDWRESAHDVDSTNGFHDVRVTPNNISQVKEDFASVGLIDFKPTTTDHLPFPHECTTHFLFAHATKL